MITGGGSWLHGALESHAHLALCAGRHQEAAAFPKQLAIVLRYWYDTMSAGILRRIILVCHTGPRSSVESAHQLTMHWTDIEHKTIKSLLHCPGHGEASPCSLHFLPLPPLPFAQPRVPRWFLLHSSFCSFKSNYMGNVSDANLFKPEHMVKSGL